MTDRFCTQKSVFLGLFCIISLIVTQKDVAKTLTAAGANGTFFFNGNNCEFDLPFCFRLGFLKSLHLRWMHLLCGQRPARQERLCHGSPSKCLAVNVFILGIHVHHLFLGIFPYLGAFRFVVAVLLARKLSPHPAFHVDLAKLSRDKINSEMAQTEEAFQRILGLTPTFTRPPYGR